MNRNKESYAANLKDPAELERVKQIIKKADSEEHHWDNLPLYSVGTPGRIPVVADGTIQTYRFSLSLSEANVRQRWQGPWTHLSIGCRIV